MRIKLFLLFFVIAIFSGCERPTEITPDSGTPPAVPTGLLIRFAQDGDILIQWNAGNDLNLKEFRIYRRINKSYFSLLNTTTNDYYYDDSLNYNDVYYYTISAVGKNNAESSLSDTVSASPLNKNNPGQPAKLVFHVNGKNENHKLSINLTWNPNDDGDIDHYSIFRDSLSEDFIPDSLNAIGTAILPKFTDTANISLYKNYYYKIKAVDKGGLLSKESPAAFDMVLDLPQILFPENDSRIPFFSDFIIKTLAVPARYKIILQTNPYFGEFWSSEFSSDLINDTLNVSFNPSYIESNITYYLRIAAFTGTNSDPNSISDLYKFVIKP